MGIKGLTSLCLITCSGESWFLKKNIFHFWILCSACWEKQLYKRESTVLPKIQIVATLLESKNLKTNNRPIIIQQFPKEQLTIGSYVSVHPSRYEARRKFGEHKRCVRVARGVAMSNSSFWSALQTSQVLHILMNAQLTYEPIVL